LAYRTRKEKWSLNKELRQRSTVNQIYDRMARATETMIQQDVRAVGSFIDVDFDVKDKAIRAARKIREKYKDDIEFKFLNQSSYGLFSKKARDWFNVGAEFVDHIGGLLKADEGREKEHLDVLLGTAKDKKKMVHIHVDELNIPDEKETELLARKTIEYKMQGKVVAIHSISINAHPLKYRLKLYKLCKEAGIMFISCPISWLNEPRRGILTPTHNPLTPVDELVPRGFTVGIGTDNIADIWMPFNDANMWNDLRVLMEAARYYELNDLVKIATTNGLKILGIKS
ncbi:amidohydrolase family protein, partial [Candidatus Roizmanbacteria bacterium]|nr:amidohydrolase family protein [Candidatus Roizmanbacteria bacterium]